MARVKNITRTIKITQVTALMLNVETAEPFNAHLILREHIRMMKLFSKPLKKNMNMMFVRLCILSLQKLSQKNCLCLFSVLLN